MHTFRFAGFLSALPVSLFPFPYFFFFFSVSSRTLPPVPPPILDTYVACISHMPTCETSLFRGVSWVRYYLGTYVAEAAAAAAAASSGVSTRNSYLITG
ncbi:hypothetical protein GGS23DRAFT_339771 [Durotheca rogersii]|uniref:uncharacterized protein n=1 Tax=Durotheca rogersii TaxID=419775 RepID=UPI00221F1F28|nr:uncharacterized protein GGS23DRAFT_339771 [Durotheca rogersii]KAI5858226.1 hypothetical protein GGS23DRAFT_339771 [Durotheca rogersii]